MLARITCPVKWLERTLNTIIDAVNRNQPIKGTGITISTQSPSGTVISLEGQQGGTDSGDPSTAAVSAGQWVSLDTMDADCNRVTYQFWVIPPANSTDDDE